MSCPNPAKDIATKIVSAGHGTSANTFYGEELPPDDQVGMAAIFVRAYAGPAPENHLGGANALHVLPVQVMVRGTRDTLEATRALAASILDTLNRATIADSVNSNNYVSCTATLSAPVLVAKTDTELPRWSVNVQLRQIY